MTDFLSEKKKEIDGRLRELRPMVDEYHRLEKAAAALAGVGGSDGVPPRRRRASAGRSRASGSGRRGRPRGSGKRALQAQELVSAQPGITIPKLAESMGIQANYLYRVMPALQKDGKIKKRGKGWHPA